jgi:hypothetical protein
VIRVTVIALLARQNDRTNNFRQPCPSAHVESGGLLWLSTVTVETSGDKSPHSITLPRMCDRRILLIERGSK